MPYPHSPFVESFNSTTITSLNPESDSKANISIEKTLKWLCGAPKVTSYRVNTLKVTPEVVKQRIQEHLNRICKVDKVLKAEYSSISNKVILIKHFSSPSTDMKRYPDEVLVDAECGAALLRGAHVYAPGVLSMLPGTRANDPVSIYVDLNGKCKKGLSKLFTSDQKLFVGNGIVKMPRRMLFGANPSLSGVAIEMVEVISGCPPLGDDYLPIGWALLQNLPSIICVDILNPLPNDLVLDMCAAPGNKTTHIAALMDNRGTLVALDKTPAKVARLKRTCEDFSVENVLIFQANSCQIFDNNLNSSLIDNGPPFASNTFDKILLDAPCSALGRRPQLANRTKEKVIKSYVPLQRKLLASAINLLKPNGTLVYSTCTITLAENEGIVAWALQTFDCIDLMPIESQFGGPGWTGTGLCQEDLNKVLRFGPEDQSESEDLNKVLRFGFKDQTDSEEDLNKVLRLRPEDQSDSKDLNKVLRFGFKDQSDSEDLNKVLRFGPEDQTESEEDLNKVLRLGLEDQSDNEDLNKVLRFRPEEENDSVGFFIARFVKKNDNS